MFIVVATFFTRKMEIFDIKKKSSLCLIFYACSDKYNKDKQIVSNISNSSKDDIKWSHLGDNPCSLAS